MRRRGFLASIAAAVAAASMEVCGIREEVKALVEPIQKIRFCVYETIGITVVNANAISKCKFD